MDAATDEIVQRLVATLDTCTLVGLRNRTILLLGFDGALRRAELVDIYVEHVTLEARVKTSDDLVAVQRHVRHQDINTTSAYVAENDPIGDDPGKAVLW